ncbi:MAG: zinc metallopeptidase [Alphaproteobacteria bacterium]|nr:zinc metallopeptidase [Alphaproteobacteria bacterium]
MPALIAIAGLVLVALIFGPQIWVRRVMARHGVDRPDLPGTGAKLARHLLDAAELTAVTVEKSDRGDHYDPQARTVRLTPSHYDGRSISAVAVAAHEVSHAVQHAREEPAFMRRLELVGSLVWVERIASAILMLAPIVFVLARAPLLMVVQILAGIALLGIRVVVHATTLPVEFDASFGKALPVLMRGRYLAAGDLPAAQSVLKAAAFTYVAAALATLLDVIRWFRILRF